LRHQASSFMMRVNLQGKEVLMSQRDGTVEERLWQGLQKVKAGGEGTDWLREIVECVMQTLLETEFTDFIGAERYERSEGRHGYRNGYRERDLCTRVGTLTLRVPRDRGGQFSTELFERYQRSEKALVLALQEMYLQGVSTRKLRRVTEKLCGTSFSKDQVSRMTQALDEELALWRRRPLTKRYPYLVIDARYEHVREDGQVENDAVLHVMGIDEEGYRDMLSVGVAPGEEEESWGEVLRDLLDRGLDAEAVRCVVSDEHRGLGAAVQRYLPRAMCQRCQAHYQRNAGTKVPRKARAEVHARLRDVFEAPDFDEAWGRVLKLAKEWEGRFPEFIEWMLETIEESLTVFHLPGGRRRRLRTTNGLERYGQEFKRRSRVIRIFPNRASCLRLATALGMEQSEEWLTGYRYLDMSVSEQGTRQEHARELEEVVV